ncbi:adenine nucleotide alpha hydrolase family protein [Roseixanthobacter glucoisosaccharinicivorans]|uniref:electron transfer flavoprotein subunit beta n=1 Tax=Roseixanthobacter glucoisosaccharinicivorans TaxID=3119923 RepID=UPI00372AA69A
MKALVLLSQARHPVSGKACLQRAEAQAARLAAGLDAAPHGLHAGPALGALRDGLGRGLCGLTHLVLAADADPVPALTEAIQGAAPDVVLAGPRGQGGEDTGLVPYALAHRLGWPLIPDAVALVPGDETGTAVVEQALPRGARRRVTVRLPIVVTVHAGAPAPLPFAFARARHGDVEVRAAHGPVVVPEGEERPYRKRPKLAARPTGGTAGERLAAAIGGTSAGGRVLVGPTPEEAAREILAFLRRIGV